MKAAFKAFRRFNDPELESYAAIRGRIDTRAYDHFGESAFPDKIVRALAERRAVPVKEVFESFEFFERTRTRLRAPVVADLCCGHGLTGVLFAAFEREVEEVFLVDSRKPDSADVIIDAVATVAPWIRDKVRFLETRIQHATRHLPPNTTILGIHACGTRTDRCLDIATALDSNVAVMPCCYARTADSVPRASREALGAELATDIDRTYRMTQRGYRVEWTAIPEVVTPMHRILVCTREGGAPSWDEIRLETDVSTAVIDDIWYPRWGKLIVTPTGTYTPADVEALLLTAADGDRTALITWVVHDDDTAEIVSLNAIPPGSGHGTRALDTARAALRARGITRLKLFTTEDNHGALRFFRRHGFRLTRIHADAMDHVRTIKPDTPALDAFGAPLRDVWEMETVFAN